MIIHCFNMDLESAINVYTKFDKFVIMSLKCLQLNIFSNVGYFEH